MKKLLIILVLLILLGAGAAAGWWLYLRKGSTAPAAPPPVTYSKLDLDVLPVSVIKNNRVARVFFFKLTLIFDGPEKKDKTATLLPLVIDGFNTELHQLMARRLMEQTDYDPDLIITRLQEVADRVTGPGTIHQVTIANVDRKDFK
jgi:hypothetical protein